MFNFYVANPATFNYYLSISDKQKEQHRGQKTYHKKAGF